jgi:hypothetical protein
MNNLLVSKMSQIYLKASKNPCISRGLKIYGGKRWFQPSQYKINAKVNKINGFKPFSFFSNHKIRQSYDNLA